MYEVHACSVASVVSDSCNPTDCSPSGSSVHGILQAGILEVDVLLDPRLDQVPLKADPAKEGFLASFFFFVNYLFIWLH